MKSSDTSFVVGKKRFENRLLLGSGRYRTKQDFVEALENSQTQLVTVAIKRVGLGQQRSEQNVLDVLLEKGVPILPNTAGCKTADEAILVAKLARESLGTELIKLEVIPDQDYLLPDPIGTLTAAEKLVNEGFCVMPYINADPVLAKRMEEVGCSVVMPLGSPIGSSRGILNESSLEIIIEQASVPVVVDAGLGVPSDATKAMEMGASAVLVNTAIAQAKKPGLMAKAFRTAVLAGIDGFFAGRTEIKKKAVSSSPIDGTPFS